MILTGFNININSENPEKLVEFYKNVVGLENDENMGPSAFKITENTNLIIDTHSQVIGEAKQPARVLINFMVNNIDEEQDRLEEKGVVFSRSKGKEEWGGIISTFTDPDGNYLQLIEYRPEHE